MTLIQWATIYTFTSFFKHKQLNFSVPSTATTLHMFLATVPLARYHMCNGRQTGSVLLEHACP